MLRLARLGVASRPGFPPDRLRGVLDRLAAPERVAFFELEVPLASRELRGRHELEGGGRRPRSRA